jgi:hypothetical protein
LYESGSKWLPTPIFNVLGFMKKKLQKQRQHAAIKGQWVMRKRGVRIVANDRPW